MNLSLKDKVVIVTGGGKGIGAGISKAFTAEGAIVCILGRTLEPCEDLVESIRAEGGTAEAYRVEMTDENAVKDTVGAILKRHGKIDVIINNAGRNDAIGLRHSVEEFEQSLRSNVVHFFSLVHHALEALIASKGVIINIGSKCSVTGQGGTSGYAASKGAINALTREWALDLRDYGIRVNCVVPAEVITPLYEEWLNRAPDPKAAREQLNRTIPLGRRDHHRCGGGGYGCLPGIPALLAHDRPNSIC
jgi:L-fucose dehydrogenase